MLQWSQPWIGWVTGQFGTDLMRDPQPQWSQPRTGWVTVGLTGFGA